MDKPVETPNQPADKTLIYDWLEDRAIALARLHRNSWLRFDEGLALPVRVLDSEVPLHTTSEWLTVGRLMVGPEEGSGKLRLTVEGFLDASENLFDVRRPDSSARKCLVHVLEDGSGWLWFDESLSGDASNS